MVNFAFIIKHLMNRCTRSARQTIAVGCGAVSKQDSSCYQAASQKLESQKTSKNVFQDGKAHSPEFAELLSSMPHSACPHPWTFLLYHLLRGALAYIGAEEICRFPGKLNRDS